MLSTNHILQQGRYRIVNQLGITETGVGYEIFDTVLKTNFLLTEIREDSGKLKTASQMESENINFAEKAKVLTGLRHESLLSVKDYFSEVDRHYLVTEFSDARTAHEFLEKNQKPLSLAQFSSLADALLDALNYLHTLNPPIIHGEIKPPNIKIPANGKIKLSTVNLIKNVGESSAAKANQTFDAAALPYLPLEQIWDGLDSASRKVILTNYDEKSEKILEQPVDARSDVYSLAATLYYLLTARIPADALTRSIDLLEGKNDPLQSPSQINSSVPREISDVLMKSLEIKRENRFSSAVIVRQVLRTAFVRVRERENEVKSVKNDQALNPQKDAVLEIPSAALKPVTTAPVSAPKNPEIESEQIRQLELIKQQLREAEQLRLEAESRAADAEKRLLEVEKHISVEPSAKKETVENFTPPAVPFENEPQSNRTEESSGLFGEPPKEGGIFKKIAAVAAILVVLGGAAFGIWTLTKSKSADAVQAVTTNNTPLPAPTNESTPTVETAPPTNYQAVSATPAPTETSAPAETTKPAANPATVKPKTAATPLPPQTAQVKKPTETPAKTAEAKKKVTLDDLLKDN